MNWNKLLAENRVAAELPSKVELDNLRSIVIRSLKDVTAPGLSADTRFVLAYDAARTLSLIIVRAAGYCPKAMGGHCNTFLALAEADPAFNLRIADTQPTDEKVRKRTESARALLDPVATP
jgi:hypothetical protein